MLSLDIAWFNGSGCTIFSRKFERPWIPWNVSRNTAKFLTSKFNYILLHEKIRVHSIKILFYESNPFFPLYWVQFRHQNINWTLKPIKMENFRWKNGANINAVLLRPWHCGLRGFEICSAKKTGFVRNYKSYIVK